MTKTQTPTFRPSEATDLADKPLGPPSATVLAGEVMTRSHVAFTSEDGTVLAGTWECEPGASRWEFLTRMEVIHVVGGRMVVQRDGEEPVELSAGSSAVFPLGWCGTWTVLETLRKSFVVVNA